MTAYAAHVAGGCLDNVTDPGWCVSCGREIQPPGGEPAEVPPPPSSAPFRDAGGFARVLRLLDREDGAGGGAP